VYAPVIQHFRLWLGDKPMNQVRLLDLQEYAKSLRDDKPRTMSRKLCTIKSLLTFAHKVGFIPYNVGGVLRLPKIPSDLAEKILEAHEIVRMIEREPEPRNQVLLRVLYGAGIRASEASGLRWMDLIPRKKGGQITVLGKGCKTRSILVSEKTWDALQSIRPPNARPERPVFVSREGPKDEPRALGRTSISIIVRHAAERAGLEEKVSAHWMRHGHATHALDNGTELTVICRTLGHESITTTMRYLHARPNQSSATGLGV
jgi:integrase/recombinase XerD